MDFVCFSRLLANKLEKNRLINLEAFKTHQQLHIRRNRRKHDSNAGARRCRRRCPCPAARNSPRARRTRKHTQLNTALNCLTLWERLRNQRRQQTPHTCNCYELLFLLVCVWWQVAVYYIGGALLPVRRSEMFTRREWELAAKCYKDRERERARARASERASERERKRERSKRR